MIFFNPYINASLNELKSKRSGSYQYGGDNTFGAQSRVKDFRLELSCRLEAVLNTVDSSCGKIADVLSQAQSAPIFSRKFQQRRIPGAGVSA